MTKLQRKLVRLCGGTRPGKIRGGRGRRLSVLDVDPRQLSMGVDVEREHTPSKRIACEIALDHLAEDRRYYTKLKKARL